MSDWERKILRQRAERGVQDALSWLTLLCMGYRAEEDSLSPQERDDWDRVEDYMLALRGADQDYWLALTESRPDQGE